MQPAHNVKFRHRFAVSGGRRLPGLLQRHRVGAVRALRPSKRAQPARRDAHVRRVDVAIHIEVRHIAMQPLPHRVRQPAHRQNVARTVQGQPIVAAEPLPGGHLIGEGQQPRIVGLERVLVHLLYDNSPDTRPSPALVPPTVGDTIPSDSLTPFSALAKAPGTNRLRPRIAWLVALLLSSSLTSLEAAQPQKPAIFPTVSGYSLNKDKVDFPSGMQGQTDLLLISFAPEQQKDIDSWLPAAQALQHSNFQFRWYELPVSSKENFIFRWWETSSIRSDQTDPETWPWIVPLFVDRHQFQQNLAIPNEKQIVALLVNRQGQILWRASGPMTPDKRASLMAAAIGQH